MILKERKGRAYFFYFEGGDTADGSKRPYVARAWNAPIRGPAHHDDHMIISAANVGKVVLQGGGATGRPLENS